MKKVLVFLVILGFTSPGFCASRIDVGVRASIPTDSNSPNLYQETNLLPPTTTSFEVWGGYQNEDYSFRAGYKNQKTLRNQGDLITQEAHVEVGMRLK